MIFQLCKMILFPLKIPDDRNCIEIRVAVMGNVDAGKSTLIGVLTQGSLDDGSGAARVNLFRHAHEIKTGNTSSISNEILGFDQEGNEINYRSYINAEEICMKSAKIVKFIDLAGHEKYMHTTIRGVTIYAPHYAMLVVNGTTGVVGTTRDHLGLAFALEVPVFVVITKADLASPHTLNETLEHLERLLKSFGIRKVPLRVEDEDTVMTAGRAVDGQIVPIFAVSSVSGYGLDLLKQYLHLLSPLTAREREKMMQEPPEFHIYEIVRLPKVGTVLGGLVRRGVLTEGSELLVGPFVDGEFQRARISSIHRNKQPYRAVYAGHSASVVLDMEFDDLIRKGMVLLCPMAKPEATFHFSATICVLYHSTEIHPGFETTVYIGNVQQTAVVEHIHNPSFLHIDDRASVVYRFKQYPEYIQPGSRLFFRTGNSKGIGKVTRIAKVLEDLKLK
ncbi:hypothetical protein QYM36_007197 [Artemia franciscana]|uniref:Tr-type G domain-containing protein n=2 Tax=Artemia franciscana TaxID=6661 RepID=A0AA88L2Z9_ARTSF|nr:hypothetical protein QYM36_007197 [Artemia franciscana]